MKWRSDTSDDWPFVYAGQPCTAGVNRRNVRYVLFDGDSSVFFLLLL